MAMAQGCTQITPTKLGRDQPPAAVILPDAPVQAFAKLPFGRFRKENGSDLYTPQRGVNPKLVRMVQAWKNFHVDEHDYHSEINQNALAAVAGIECLPSDLEKFMVLLSKFQGETNFSDRAGPFITALINAGPEDRYVVRTSHLDVPLFDLGMFNKKEILVDGNGGAYVGCLMQGGRLTVNGDAGPSAGYEMEGGNLIVTGNVEHIAGRDMKGGCLIILGNAGFAVGWGMEGGEIHIYGECQDLAHDNEIRGGRIFVGGVQVYPSQTSGSVHGSVPEDDV